MQVVGKTDLTEPLGESRTGDSKFSLRTENRNPEGEEGSLVCIASSLEREAQHSSPVLNLGGLLRATRQMMSSRYKKVSIYESARDREEVLGIKANL